MANLKDDNILYVAHGEDPLVVRSQPSAAKLVSFALVLLILFLARAPLSVVRIGRPSALEPIEEVTNAKVLTSFDASSGDFSSCDGIAPQLPDFSIVVAGTGSGTGRQAISRVVQFVVVSTDHDHRYGRDGPRWSLCTLS